MTEDKQYSWDAEDYEQHSSAQQSWARELMKKLDLQGHESVLDIGCGDGKVTAEIAALLPEGEVLGIDSSPDMLYLAREKFSWSTHPNLSFQERDAKDLTCEAEFDVVFSSAALHWVLDHRPVLTGISRALKLGGRILLQMAGKGNAASVIAVLDELLQSEKWQPYFTDFTFPYGFYGPELYKAWLSQAGLHPIRVELIPKDMSYPDRTGLEGWVRTTWLPYTERVPVEQRDAFITAIVDKYLEEHPADNEGQIHVEMVRLEVEACPGKYREMNLIDLPSPTDAP
ncbi:MAG: methyltransferase domain-containing protein [Candidatus Electrothrix aestuarii]|uniref:Methyltransferase domain-containing protein n=1 Tax=Candidatus Electrothrix aestuarii TaxID=3062594 RepID=A0AAU8LYR0_9BACT|nr:methyltransferase domain-containing protein [Candidatus Electrothrix aestuarii]